MCFQESIRLAIPSLPCWTPTTYPTANPTNANMHAPWLVVLSHFLLGTFLLGDHLDAHPHVGVDPEHEDLRWFDPELTDVEDLLPLDEQRALVGGGDGHLAFDRPCHAVKRQIAPDLVCAAVLLELGGLAPDPRETPGVDAAHHLGVLELLTRLEVLHRQLDADLRNSADVDAAISHVGLDGALEP